MIVQLDSNYSIIFSARDTDFDFAAIFRRLKNKCFALILDDAGIDC